MIYRTTLDIDFTDKWNKLKPKDYEFIENVVNKISKCPFFVDLWLKLSAYKGVHIIIICSIKCDICRFVYDDTKRFAYDLSRPVYARNILADKKERIKI